MGKSDHTVVSWLGI